MATEPEPEFDRTMLAEAIRAGVKASSPADDLQRRISVAESVIADYILTRTSRYARQRPLRLHDSHDSFGVLYILNKLRVKIITESCPLWGEAHYSPPEHHWLAAESPADCLCPQIHTDRQALYRAIAEAGDQLTSGDSVPENEQPGPASKIPPRYCQQCGSKYTPTRSDQRFDTATCRKRAQRARQAAEQSA